MNEVIVISFSDNQKFQAACDEIEAVLPNHSELVGCNEEELLLGVADFHPFLAEVIQICLRNKGDWFDQKVCEVILDHYQHSATGQR